eukprot:c16493_g1_i1.p1 GENE.c16493_g1_i1~~c16493_g1_i1.p1  ORF type:complete len:150 (+),score=39.51 c16493_g1_i1:1-450(+)
MCMCHILKHFFFNFMIQVRLHVCEVQLVHVNMMLARTNMGAHKQYERFRSALELLEATGHKKLIQEIEISEQETPQKSKQAGEDQSQSNVLRIEIEQLRTEMEQMKINHQKDLERIRSEIANGGGAQSSRSASSNRNSVRSLFRWRVKS